MSRRTPIHRLLSAALLLSILVLSPAVALAQDSATPDPFAGVTTVALAATPSQTADGYTLLLLRVTMSPGAEISSHQHPGDVALTVESGTFETVFTHGTGTITRAAPDGATPVTETAETNVDQTLTAGDALAYGADNHHVMRNGGDDDLVLLISALLASDQSGFLFSD